MTLPRFIEMHVIQTFTGSLLNRDDNGLAKRLLYGGYGRTRISSQCLKYHWNHASDIYSLGNIPGAEEAYRSRNIVDRLIMQNLPAMSDPELFNEEGIAIDPEVIAAMTEVFNVNLYNKNGKEEKERQAILMGYPEVAYLRNLANQICMEHPHDAEKAKDAVRFIFSNKGDERNFRAFRELVRLPGGLQGAMFGRMITSDLKANIEGPIHVAHSITVHREETESDYFSAVDVLNAEINKIGSALLKDTELTSGLFYTYVVVDVPTLVSNLEGVKPEDWTGTDREMAAQVIRNLMYLIARVTPGAKLGSTAPHSRARFMMVQIGEDQPWSLAEAFRVPVQPNIRATLDAISTEISKQDRAYGQQSPRKAMVMDDEEGYEVPGTEKVDMDRLTEWVRDAVRKGEVA